MKRLLLPLAMAIAATGCSLSRPAAERQSFLLQPRHPAAAAGNAVGAGVRVGRIDVAAPFAGRGFVYRRDEQRFETDFYNEFAADPADMVADAAVDWLRRSGRHAPVLGPRSPGQVALRVDGEIAALYVDFRGDPAARLAVRWRFSRDDGPAAEKECEAAVPLAARTPGGAARAQEEALARALACLEASLPN